MNSDSAVAPVTEMRVSPSWSSRLRRRLLLRRDPGQRTIEGNGPVHGGRLIARQPPVHILSRSHHTVIPPDIGGFAVQKADRLHLTGIKYGHEEIPHRADVLHIEDDPVGGSMVGAQSVGRLAGEIIDLFKVEGPAWRQLIRAEIF